MSPRPDRSADPDGYLCREEFYGGLDSLRSEFTAGLTTAGVQIGAVEKTLVAKMGNLRLWGVLAIVGGQSVAAIVTAYLKPGLAHQATAALLRFL